MGNSPPVFLQPFLWSFDLAEMDVERDKRMIIKQVLDYGTAEATDWLKKTYTEDEIRSAIASSTTSDWSKKSLALWQLAYDIEPAKAGRFA